MDENLNELLVQEIKKSTEKLEKDKEQLNDELNKLMQKNETQISEKLGKDLEYVIKELSDKQNEIEAVENLKNIKNEVEALNERISSLIAERKKYENMLNEAGNKLELKDGKYEPNSERIELKSDLEKINSEISSTEILKKQKEQNLKISEKQVEGLLAKYHINEKVIQEQEDKMWEQYRKEQEDEKSRQIDEAFEQKKAMEERQEEQIQRDTRKEIVTDSLDSQKLGEQQTQTPIVQQPVQQQVHKSVEQPQIDEPAHPKLTFSFVKEEDRPSPLQAISSITCTVIDGQIKYIFHGVDNNGNPKTISSEIGDNGKLTPMEEKALRNNHGLSNFDIINIDPAIIDIFGMKSDLFKQYAENVKNTIDGNERKINITYDLSKIKEAKGETPRDVIRQLKKMAKINSRNGIADYIKPRSKIREFFERFTRKSLSKPVERQEDRDDVAETLRQLSSEAGFDINQFYEDLEKNGEKLTPERKQKLDAIYSANEGKRYRGGFKVPKRLEKISQKAIDITTPDREVNTRNSSDDKEK